MKRYRLVFRIIAIALCIGAGYWFVKAAISSATNIQWSELDLTLIGAALVAAVLQECIGTAIAQTALAAFSQRAPFGRMLVITTASTATNSLVPMPVGVPARVWLQKKWLDIPVSSSTAGIVLETLSGYGTLALFALLGAYLFGTNIIALGTRYVPAVLAIVAVLLLVAWLLRERLNAYLEQLRKFRPTTVPAVATVALNLVVIALATLRLWLILRAAGSATPPLLELTGALCIARFAGVASMIPMGLGSRDVTLTGLLVLAHVPLPFAVLAAAIDRVLSTLPYVVVALTGLPLLRRLGAPATRPVEPR